MTSKRFSEIAQAYDRGHAEGYDKGYDDGYDEGAADWIQADLAATIAEAVRLGLLPGKEAT